MPPTTPPITLEVCVDSLTSAKAAASQGASRVELNVGLELGGLTPSIGLVEPVVAALQPLSGQVIAMIRPRPGGFAYDADELAVMQRDIDRMLTAGVDGVALGVLSTNGTVDVDANRALVQPVLQAGRQAVFHRAFDLTPDPIAAMDCLISLGFHRILTSGQAPTAIQGAAVIRQLIQHANERIEVLPGSGISPDNVAELIRKTACTQVHGSLSRSIKDTSSSNNPTIQFSSPPLSDGAYKQTDPDKVASIMEVLRGISI